MATTLLSRPTYAQIDSLVLDASVTETHSSEVEVTDHPVEVGANVTDHARVKPDTITLEGLVTDTPLRPGTEPGDHAFAAYDALRALKDARRVVTVVTEIRTYTNMVMTSLTVPRDGRTGNALRFTATFKQIRLAEVRKKEVTVTREPRAKAKTPTGKQATPEAPEPYRSTLKAADAETHQKYTNPIRRPRANVERAVRRKAGVGGVANAAFLDTP